MNKTFCRNLSRAMMIFNQIDRSNFIKHSNRHRLNMCHKNDKLEMYMVSYLYGYGYFCAFKRFVAIFMWVCFYKDFGIGKPQPKYVQNQHAHGSVIQSCWFKPCCSFFYIMSCALRKEHIIFVIAIDLANNGWRHSLEVNLRWTGVPSRVSQ